jgi:hypothetical protein
MTITSEALENVTMYASIGQAITAWASLENALCSIHSVCTAPSLILYHPNGSGLQFFDPLVSAATFYAIDNFRSKPAMVDAVVQARFKHFEEAEDLVAQWAKISEKARKLSLKRNKLAHFEVIRLDGKPSLVPPHRNPRSHDYLFGTNRPMSAANVRHLILAFQLLSDKASSLAKAMAAHPELHRIFAKLVTDQQECADFYRTQNAQESQEPAPPSQG